jgi:predicted DNA-binding protein YlxM (UPF0122 family)
VTMARRYGERNGNAKLTDDQVGRICWLYHRTDATRQQLADGFGVSLYAIHYALTRRWKRLRKSGATLELFRGPEPAQTQQAQQDGD